MSSQRSTNPDAPDSVGMSWELAAESITVRIRWFGLLVGYVLVNFVGSRPAEKTAVLNAILTLGAVYAVIDALWSYRSKVFLSRMPIVISVLEAIFIGLLCYFDSGINSPFRFYYFLSLLVCAIRHSPRLTYTTLALHGLSFSALATSHWDSTQDAAPAWSLTVIVMAWVTWAGTALAALLKRAGQR
ncbi:MAG: two-component sensor histidine kinase, partial [Planctomycetaceae bacterium]